MGRQMRGRDDCGVVVLDADPAFHVGGHCARRPSCLPCVVMEEDDVKLNTINAWPATTDCMSYQHKCDTIRCRDPNEAGWGAPCADHVCKSTGIFLSPRRPPRTSSTAAPGRLSPQPPPRTTPRLSTMGVNADEYDGSHFEINLDVK